MPSTTTASSAEPRDVEHRDRACPPRPGRPGRRPGRGSFANVLRRFACARCSDSAGQPVEIPGEEQHQRPAGWSARWPPARRPTSPDRCSVSGALRRRRVRPRRSWPPAGRATRVTRPPVAAAAARRSSSPGSTIAATMSTVVSPAISQFWLCAGVFSATGTAASGTRRHRWWSSLHRHHRCRSSRAGRCRGRRCSTRRRPCRRGAVPSPLPPLPLPPLPARARATVTAVARATVTAVARATVAGRCRIHRCRRCRRCWSSTCHRRSGSSTQVSGAPSLSHGDGIGASVMRWLTPSE